jgi:hypothetical protein
MAEHRQSNKHLPGKGQVMTLTLENSDEKVVLEPVSDLKTFDQCIDVADLLLEDKIMSAFHLAKSAGRELNVTFTSDSLCLH